MTQQYHIARPEDVLGIVWFAGFTNGVAQWRAARSEAFAVEEATMSTALKNNPEYLMVPATVRHAGPAYRLEGA